MEQDVITTVVLPAALFFIMLGMGLGLKRADFARVVQYPKAAAIGVLCQMLLLPIVGFGIVKLIAMDEPALAVGLMVLTFCPGGTTSNMLTLLARGDVALSITLTAIVSAVTPFTIPLLTALAMRSLMGADEQIEMPIVKTMVVLLAITVVPVIIGMVIHHKWPEAAAKADKPVKIGSVVFLFLIIAGLVLQYRAHLGEWFAQVGPATLILNVTTMVLAYAIARGAGLERKQQITIGMEVGIQNGTTALLVTGTLLGNAAMTIAPAIYSLLMFATGGLFGYLVNLATHDEPSAS
jgi:BASS family bile acid:Na+ symporter